MLRRLCQFDEQSANACHNQKANHISFFSIWMAWFFFFSFIWMIAYIFQINNMIIFIYIIIMNNNDWTACIQFFFFGVVDMTDKILFCSFNLSNIYLDIYLVGHNLDLEPILGPDLSISFCFDLFLLNIVDGLEFRLECFSLIFMCTYFRKLIT